MVSIHRPLSYEPNTLATAPLRLLYTLSPTTLHRESIPQTPVHALGVLGALSDRCADSWAAEGTEWLTERRSNKSIKSRTLLRFYPPSVDITARLAQSVEREALNLVVVGSSPTVGVFATLRHARCRLCPKNRYLDSFSDWL